MFMRTPRACPGSRKGVLYSRRPRRHSVCTHCRGTWMWGGRLLLLLQRALPRQAAVFATLVSCALRITKGKAPGRTKGSPVFLTLSLVGAGRIELPTSTVSMWRSPTELRACVMCRRTLARSVGGADRNRTGDGGFADLCLTAWLRRHARPSRGKCYHAPPELSTRLETPRHDPQTFFGDLQGAPAASG